MERESSILEYKEDITNTFLRTVSAFANYQDGKIIFGVRDDGTVKGIPQAVQKCLDIENKINELDLYELETIILQIVKNELRHIEVLGLILGFFIGIVQGIITIFI